MKRPGSASNCFERMSNYDRLTTSAIKAKAGDTKGD